MNGREEPLESRQSSRRIGRRRRGHGPGVAEVRRKLRNQGPLGWLRKSAYSQRSPLVILAVLLAGIGLTALILVEITRSRPSLPPSLTENQP
jgi:hypothetical protein